MVFVSVLKCHNWTENVHSVISVVWFDLYILSAFTCCSCPNKRVIKAHSYAFWSNRLDHLVVFLFFFLRCVCVCFAISFAPVNVFMESIQMHVRITIYIRHICRLIRFKWYGRHKARRSNCTSYCKFFLELLFDVLFFFRT